MLIIGTLLAWRACCITSWVLFNVTELTLKSWRTEGVSVLDQNRTCQLLEKWVTTQKLEAVITEQEGEGGVNWLELNLSVWKQTRDERGEMRNDWRGGRGLTERGEKRFERKIMICKNKTVRKNRDVKKSVRSFYWADGWRRTQSGNEAAWRWTADEPRWEWEEEEGWGGRRRA